MPASGADPDWLVAGQVGRPHGLDGSFHVRDARPRLLAEAEQLRVAGSERRIERRAGTDRDPILRLAGCSDRDGAQALRGESLLVPRTAAPPLEPDEWYAEDLEGCEVVDGEEHLGTVRRLIPLPSCEALEVERPNAADLLIPLVKNAVREVDVGSRRIDVDMTFLTSDN